MEGVGVPLVGEGLGLGELVGEGLGLGELVGEGFGFGDLVGEGLGFGDLVGEGLGFGELVGEGFGLGELVGAGFGLGELAGEGLGLLVVELVCETGLVEEGCGFGCWFPELATGDFRSFEGDTLTTGFCIGLADGWFWGEIGDREVG